MPFTIIMDDISRVLVYVMVSAANTSLQYGSGVCGAMLKVRGEATAAWLLQEFIDVNLEILVQQYGISTDFRRDLRLSQEGGTGGGSFGSLGHFWKYRRWIFTWCCMTVRL